MSYFPISESACKPVNNTYGNGAAYPAYQNRTCHTEHLCSYSQNRTFFFIFQRGSHHGIGKTGYGNYHSGSCKLCNNIKDTQPGEQLCSCNKCNRDKYSCIFFDQAAAYLSELKASACDTTLGICENPIIDAFLHNKIESARVSGVEIRAKVSLGAGLPVSNVDLVRAFGNLLDNAVEACSGTAGACVVLTCAQLNGCLVIRCENPVSESPAEKSRRIPELDRGVGSRVLKALVEKYNGSLKQERQNGTFRAELILNLAR